MTKKKVAMIGPELYPIPPIRGGASELWIDQTCRHLKKYRPFIFSPADPELPLLEERGGVTYFRIPLSRLKKALYGWIHRPFCDYERRIVPLLKEIDPDLIHIHNRPLPVSFFQEHFPGKIIIFHMHNLYDYLGRREKPHGHFEIPADLTIGCSRFVLESERDRLVRGSRRQQVVYNGVDTEAFQPAWRKEGLAREMRRRYGLEGKKVVLYTGKIREAKGVGLLFSAMEEVFRQEPASRLVLAGGTGFGYRRTGKETEFSRELGRRIQPYGERVLPLGFIPPQEMPAVYLLGDVFAAPSQLEEGLALVFLEASAAGLPVIGTRLGGIPEEVIEGKTGFLLKEKDNVAELAAKILHLLRDPEYGRELGRAGRQLMVEFFSWTKVAEVVEGLYDSFLMDS